jgi:hypothetical protein
MAKWKTFLAFTAVIVMLAFAGTSSATTLTFDPQFAIGTGLGTSCQNGQCPFFGTEVNPISGTTFDIWNTQNHLAFTASSDPILLIIGVPGTDGNPNASTFGSVTLSDGSGADGTGTLGGTPPAWMCNGPHHTMVPCGGNFDLAGAANGGSNDWTGSPNNATDFVGLPGGGSNSQGFTNWTGVEATPTLGSQTVTDFHIWVYELNPIRDIAGQSGIDVNFSSGLPFGTLVFAEGCYDYSSTPAPDCGGNNLFFTPFTTTGAVTTHHHAPEPAGLALLGSGLILLGGVLRRKLHANS